MEQREEHDIDEKKVVALKATAATNCNCGLGDHDGGEDGIRNFEQEDGKGGWHAGARAAVRPAVAARALGRGRRRRAEVSPHRIHTFLVTVIIAR